MDTPSLGNAPFGKNNLRRSVLTASKVGEIRALYGRGHVTQGQLARDYGVSVVQIGRIVRGEVWQGLGPQQVGARELEDSAARMLALQEEMLGRMEAEVPAPSSGLARLNAEVSKFVTPEMLERKKQLIGGDV